MLLTTRRLVLAVGAMLVAATPPIRAQAPIPVVASFSILADLVSEVGGDRIELTVLVGPNGDAHMYSPTPADAEAVATASIVVVNGLGFEGWMDRLIEASGYAGPVVVATQGIDPLPFEEDHEEGAEAHDDDDGVVPDPHAFQSVANARTYVANITDALVEADPDGAADYTANSERFLAELDAVEADVENAIATLPEDHRTVVTSHDAFGYYGAAYGLEFRAPQGISTESEASAADVATLITEIRDESLPAVFVENVTDNRLLEQITAETDAKIGGTLYSDALSEPDGPAGTYASMMVYNTRTLVDGLR